MSLSSINDLLRRASTQTSVVWTGRRGPIVLRSDTVRFLHDSYKVPFVGEKIVREGEWTYDTGVYQEVQEWIETHWSTSPSPAPPVGCAVSERQAQFGPRDRLDPATAAKKLILAAILHGAQAVAPCAIQFAQTGLLEVEAVYLLKGPSMGKAVALDDFCTLAPYRDAVQFRESLLDTPTRVDTWPPEHADGICVLPARGFESLEGEQGKVYMSPLLRQGHPEDVALLLGVVWGDGYTVFGHWHLVPLVTSAALPFWSIGPFGGSLRRATLLRLPMGDPYIKIRPLASQELRELLEAHSQLEDQPRRILNLAMRRLRDAAGRIDFEDQVIDLCIALEALFNDKEWEANLMQTISGRGSWHYADTVQERDGARRTLKELYETRRNIIHGNTANRTGHWPGGQSSKVLADAQNILRACLKSMVATGIPDDWERSKNHRSIWRDPPRQPSEIPSTKSDSLSWSVESLGRIDSALRTAWRSSLNRVEPLPANQSPTISIGGINEALIEQYRRGRRSFEIPNPAILYTAHPMWPKTPEDNLSERCKYYCHQDITRHMLEWQEAAREKNVQQYWIEDNMQLHRSHNPELYHPKNSGSWPVPLP
ncbi:MAG: HEPN domain-containing protein [Gemmatimonadota bacterium]|nr:HEPN domain-containing protein [Gemmatimonadota bacterium]MDE2863501.1 HEPN domain-containing protein [Gemmatimonadota bacterium]